MQQDVRALQISVCGAAPKITPSPRSKNKKTAVQIHMPASLRLTGMGEGSLANGSYYHDYNRCFADGNDEPRCRCSSGCLFLDAGRGIAPHPAGHATVKMHEIVSGRSAAAARPAGPGPRNDTRADGQCRGVVCVQSSD
jgi:hypothetical protein